MNATWCLCGCKRCDHAPDDPWPCLVCGCPAFRPALGPRTNQLALDFLTAHTLTGTREGDWFTFQLRTL